MSKLLFQPCNILLPKTDSYEKWSVIACDQFTSEPQYWEQTRSKIGNCKSTLDLILPEAYLSKDNSEKICAIHDSMNNIGVRPYWHKDEVLLSFPEINMNFGS